LCRYVTGELVAVNEMAEHMRISLIDPKWKVQKEAMLAKLRDSTMANDEEVATNVLMLARTRPDIFGSTDEEVSNAIVESIEAKKETHAPPGRAPIGHGPGPAPLVGGGGAGLPQVPVPPPPPVAVAVPPPPPKPINLGGPQLKSFAPTPGAGAMPMAPPAAPPPNPAASGPALKAPPAGLPPAPPMPGVIPMPMPVPPPPGALRPLGGGGGLQAVPPPPPAAAAAAHARQEDEDDDAEEPAKRQKVGDVDLEPEVGGCTNSIQL
jgi:splicing factor 3A subunit 1